MEADQRRQSAVRGYRTTTERSVPIIISTVRTLRSGVADRLAGVPVFDGDDVVCEAQSPRRLGTRDLPFVAGADDAAEEDGDGHRYREPRDGQQENPVHIPNNGVGDLLVTSE